MRMSLMARLSAALAALRGRVPVAPAMPQMPALPQLPDLAATRTELQAKAQAAQLVADQARAALATLPQPKR